MAGEKEYEFSSEQNLVIERLAGNMQLLAIVSLIGGGIALLISNWLFGAANIAVGLMTLAASQAFKAITKTEGQDMTNLMTAMKRLSIVYVLQTAVVILSILGSLLMTLMAAYISSSS